MEAKSLGPQQESKPAANHQLPLSNLLHVQLDSHSDLVQSKHSSSDVVLGF